MTGASKRESLPGGGSQACGTQLFTAVALLVICSPLTHAANWEAAPAFPDPTRGRLFAAGLQQDGTIFAIGGEPLGTSGGLDTPVHYLPAAATAWLEGPFAEGRVVRPGAGVDALGRIIVFGGVDGVDSGGDPGAAYVYDLIEGQYQSIANRGAAAPNDYFAWATDDQGRIYSIGGGDGPAASANAPNTNYVERYLAAGDVWEPIAPLPVPRADAAAVFDGQGHILVLGGFNVDATARLSGVLQYDIATDTWSNAAVPDLPVALTGLRAVLGADGRIYVIGGESGPIGAGTTEAAAYILEPSTNTWSAGPTMITPRRNFAAALGTDDFIYAMGGSNDAGDTHLVERLYTPPCPAITVQPASRQQWIGQTIELTADAVGGTPLSYQWYKDGVELSDGASAGGGVISGATTTTLTISTVGEADGGVYEFVAFNPCGSTPSDAAVLTVRVPPAFPQSWTVTNLHPAWANSSTAVDVSGDTQVGTCTMDIPDYNNIDRPTLWTGSAASALDLTPGGSVGGGINAAGPGVQVGWWWWPYQCQVGGNWYTCYQSHAAGWAGSPASHVNLHVSGWEYTSVSDTDGETHVGSVSRDDAVGNYFTHAVMWVPPNTSPVDLHPGSIVSKSGAVALDNGKQYGWIHTPFPGPVQHAAMWSGSSSSFVDLHPPGASRSWISDAADGQQVGAAEFGGTVRAGMWADSVTSFVEFTPTSLPAAGINACAGGLQVGSATIDGSAHAVVWRGDPDDYFDLHPLTPPEFTSSSAKGIEVAADGTITIVGSGYNSVTARQEALLWQEAGGQPTVPAVSQWGLAAMTLILLTVGTLAFRNGRRLHGVVSG